MPYPVLLSLILSLFLSSFFLLTPVIRLNLSRHDPGYHLPCHTLFFFLRHPPPPIVYPSCLSLPPRCCSSSVVGPNYHPPVLSIALLPHATLLSTELHCLQLFLVPLPATRLSHYVCIPSCPSVVSFRPSVCVCPSAFVTKAGYLPTLCIYLLKWRWLVNRSKCVSYSLISLIIGSLLQLD